MCSQYQEYEDYTHIVTEISPNEIDNNIMITLNFPFNNTNIRIKINKYCSISNIPIFIQDKFGFDKIDMILNDSVIKFGSFESHNIKNNSIIKIMNSIQTGRSVYNYSHIGKVVILTKRKSSDVKSKMSRKKINDNINKYGYWGAFKQPEIETETEIESESESEPPKKKIKKNYYKSPEYNQRRESIDPSELQHLGNKYHIAMQQLFESENKKNTEQDKMRAKITSLKEKMKKSTDKKNKVIIDEKKETFGGFKKGFLL
jgi:hypothetical protein